MDLDEFREVLGRTGVDVWAFIDAAIDVAALDCADQIKLHRDRIVERLFSLSTLQRCHNCQPQQPHPDVARKSIFSSYAVKPANASGVVNPIATATKNNNKIIGAGGGASTPPSPYSPQPLYVEDEDQEAHRFEEDDPSIRIDVDLDLDLDDEQSKILAIREHLEDSQQSEDYLVELLQSLADMDITFKALKETDIGRHVNRLRKHPSNEVRRLVKQLVRRWKDLVDEWVKINVAGGAAHALIADGDSPLQKLTQNGHQQVPDFAFSPNPHNGSSGSEKTNGEAEAPPRNSKTARREAPAAAVRPPQTSSLSSASFPHNKQREKREDIDPERLASARKRLQQNYQDAQNAKKQRTIQVMDIHEIPKPKNGFIARNKGGGTHGHARHW